MRLIIAAAVALFFLGAEPARAQAVLMAKPQMSTASRQADIKDCGAIIDGRPRDPAMVAATPALDGRQLANDIIIVPYGLGVFGAGMAGAMLAKNEEDKALDICLRLKGYVIARLTRKELGDFRERLRPAEQDAYIDDLIKSGRLEEATRPLVPALPRAEVTSTWRIFPGSLRPEEGPKKRDEALATARAVFSKEARLQSAFVVEPGKLEIPAGASFFRSSRSVPDLLATMPAWCTLLDEAAGRDKGAVLCLVYGNDGYQVYVVAPKDAAPLVGKPRIDALPTAIDLVLADEPIATPVAVTYAVTNNADWSETLVATAAFAEARLAVDSRVVNAARGADKPRKGKAPQPDIDAGPVTLDIGGQGVAVSLSDEGKGRLFEMRLDGPPAP